MDKFVQIEYYATLGLSPFATIGDVKKAYRKLGKSKCDETQLKLTFMTSFEISPG